MAVATETIPGPPGLPLIRNLLDIHPTHGLRSLQNLHAQYGNIYKLDMLRFQIITVGSHELAREVCDEKRFHKKPNSTLMEIRHGVGDGLFTAFAESEENWGIAHRVLMPAFGPVSLRGLYDEMHDVASQLVLKWARHGPKQRIHITDDFTRLALDTISLCSMGFRFNSFYDEKLHPFIDAMGEFLLEAGKRPQRLPVPGLYYRKADREFDENIRIMRETANMVLKERMDSMDDERKDLVTAMLNREDPVTGKKMTEESIVDNLITFLIAGHETTSGMLSYAVHELLRDPRAYRKVQQEVDDVIGKGPVTIDHMQKLPYIAAVLRETLRLQSPIPLFSVYPREDTTLGGKYPVSKGQNILVLLSALHKDPEVYDEPEKFIPERMLDEEFNKLPKDAWKPFGNGSRACIGRGFAWQEAILAMALVFQNFDLALDDPDYVLEHNPTLTIKPKDLYIRATLREGLNPTTLEERISRKQGAPVAKSQNGRAKSSRPGSSNSSSSKSAMENLLPMTILYGSNSGTCEALGQKLASSAPAHGFKVVKFAAMDEATRNLPRDDPKHPVVVVTASYEGEPPDNAGQFVKWIEESDKERDESAALEGTSYAVFGCGNHEWAQTFHRIPHLVDDKLSELGAKRLVKLGLADAAGEDMFMSFETWEDETLWPCLDKMQGSTGGAEAVAKSAQSQALRVTRSKEAEVASRRGVEETKVLSVKTLTAEGEEPVKKHIEIQLPPGSMYRAGDYLAILPSNPRPSVLRALRRFDLRWDDIITLEGSSITLPTNVSMYARAILSDFVELGQPITKKGVLQLAALTGVSEDSVALQSLAKDDAFATEIAAKRVSILDLLERYPSVQLDLGTFLGMLPPMRVRQYSISSSPSVDPTKASITYTIISQKAKSGHGHYHGVASSHLSSLRADDPIHVTVRSSNVHFHLPEDASASPVVMVAAGAGIAPFRGFIQERAELIRRQGGASKAKLATAILYYGCREAGRDDLYTDELAEVEALGAVTIRRAYSRRAPETNGTAVVHHKYVQDLLRAHTQELRDLWGKNAKVYVCGSRAVSRSVDEIVLQMKRDDAAEEGEAADEKELKSWWEGIRNVRYVSDVFD